MSIIQGMLISLVVLLSVYTSQSLQKEARYGQQCTNKLACNETMFLTCQKPSTSCKNGYCVCKDGYSRQRISRRSTCVRNSYLGQPCNSTIISTINGVCSGGIVVCESGYTRVNNYLCKNSSVKFLGEACDDEKQPPDTCYLYSDLYATTAGTTCSRNYCGCYGIWDGNDCRQTKLGDRCKKGDDCPRGARCVSAVCQCDAEQTQYRGTCVSPGDYGSKGERGFCDSRKKCSFGLVCVNCPENQKPMCGQPPPYSRSSTSLTDVLIVFTTSAVAVYRSLQ